MTRTQVLVRKGRRWMIKMPEMVLHEDGVDMAPLMMGSQCYLCSCHVSFAAFE